MPRIKAFAYRRLQRESRCVLRTPTTEIVVFELQGQLYAVENICPHQGLPLENGIIDPESGTLICVYHQWCFRLSDGCGSNNKSRLKTYKAEVADGYVWVETEG